MSTPVKENTLNTSDGLKEISKLCIKPIMGTLFHPVYIMVNAAICGRLGRIELAGFGLGSLTLGICCISIGIMFSISAGTLITQAFGAKDYRMCRVYLNRQYFLNSCFFPLIVIPLLFIRSVYELIGQDPEVADMATEYVHTCLPGLYFFIQG